MSAVVDREAEVVLDYDGEESRYAIYSVDVEDPIQLGGRVEDRRRRRVCETSLDGIGTALLTMRAEDEITGNSRVGIFDRLDRTWLVNPWARGDLE